MNRIYTAEQVCMLFSLTVLLVSLLGASSVPAAEGGGPLMAVYDLNWQIRYYAKDGALYNLDWQVEYYVRGDSVFDRRWIKRYYVKDNRLYDWAWQLRYYIREYRAESEARGETARPEK